MSALSKTDIIACLRDHRLAVIATRAADGAPQAAVVGIAVSDGCDVIFDTTSDSRKHINLTRDPRIALVVYGAEETTLQLEGLAHMMPASGVDGAALREAYYATWPDGRDRLRRPNLAYWRIAPHWARLSNFAATAVIREWTSPA
ncbi:MULTISPECIES: pyridoxamine 5'-phosphate oxidase family protein [unclassified Bradyrhizobium]|uniref:pyridoxamine 5'-phosphate oxidase family protein n=1 Tax=unclassified Bradyrhizobium TaxID=2631580 RepID=UPI002012FA55|nr:MULTISPECIES: pyridoxamine 5'-phosphate oxidase family protein [unclassified Bradyrhizobium]